MTNSNVSNSSSSIQSTGIYSSELGGDGLDVTMMIQLLIMRDCDEQLKELGKDLKANNNLKKEYRNEIKKLKAALTQPACKKDGSIDSKDATKNDRLNIKGFSNDFTTIKGFQADPITREIKEYTTKQFGELITSKDKNGTVTIEKKSLETLIENLNDEKDNLTDAQETISMQIQTLTNLRKSSLETASNCISKENEGNSSIIRNMRG